MAAVAYIHCGTTKTGSTSIQEFLHNAKRSDFCYPLVCCGSENSSHWVLSNIFANSLDIGRGFAHLKGSWESISSLAIHVDNQLQAQVSLSLVETFIFSSEHFWHDCMSLSDSQQIEYLVNLRRYFCDSLGFSDLKIILYVRGQIAHINSDWIQSLKDRNKNSFNNFLVNHCFSTSRYSHHYFLLKLIGVFGEENVIVKSFEGASRTDRGLISDFLGACALETLPSSCSPGPKKNVSAMLSAEACSLLLGFNQQCSDQLYHASRHSPFFYSKLGSVVNASCMHTPSPEDMKKISDYFKSANYELCMLTGIDLNEENHCFAMNASSVYKSGSLDLPHFLSVAMLNPWKHVDSSSVIFAYRYLLERDPLDLEVDARIKAGQSIVQLIFSILVSKEFDQLYLESSFSSVTKPNCF
jgi:hypothetical protein